MLDETTLKTVLEAVHTVEHQQLLPEQAGLILAHLYKGYGLYSDAVEVLEGLVQQGSQLITIYQLLGDTYLEVGLPQLAKKSYEKALELGTGTEHLSVQAEVQAGLGKAHNSLGNEGYAIQWLKKAKGSYAELGDSVQVQRLAAEIDTILGKP
jgi:tetratricopeptide (TPR) repeat protein